MKPKILVVDDEPDALEVLGYKLREAGYTPVFAADGVKALAAVRAERPDLIVLDLMLPELDGMEVCKILRRDPATVAIPIRDAHGQSGGDGSRDWAGAGRGRLRDEALQPSRTGAPDTKLLKRVQTADEAGDHLRVGPVEIDVPSHEARVDSKPVTLTATEFNLLLILARRRGRVQTRERLLQDVWGYETAIDTRTVDTHMRRLSEKIGPAAELLETIRGVGYRFKAENAL